MAYSITWQMSFENSLHYLVIEKKYCMVSTFLPWPYETIIVKNFCHTTIQYGPNSIHSGHILPTPAPYHNCYRIEQALNKMKWNYHSNFAVIEINELAIMEVLLWNNNIPIHFIKSFLLIRLFQVTDDFR